MGRGGGHGDHAPDEHHAVVLRGGAGVALENHRRTNAQSVHGKPRHDYIGSSFVANVIMHATRTRLSQAAPCPMTTTTCNEFEREGRNDPRNHFSESEASGLPANLAKDFFIDSVVFLLEAIGFLLQLIMHPGRLLLMTQSL